MADGTPSGPAGHPGPDTAGAGDAGVSDGSEAVISLGTNLKQPPLLSAV